MKLNGKYAWIGTHSSAKTTTINRLSRFLSDLGVEHIVVSEVARDCPLPVNKESGFFSQIWMLGEQIRREKLASQTKKLILCDRSVWDYLVYGISLYRRNMIKKHELDVIEKKVIEHVSNEPYTVIYFCKPRPIYDDGFRDIDPMWQKEIYDIFNEVIEKYDVEVSRVN